VKKKVSVMNQKCCIPNCILYTEIIFMLYKPSKGQNVLGTKGLNHKFTDFPESRSHLKILNAARVTKNKFHTEEPQILGAII
jgi:hypothetical protein